MSKEEEFLARWSDEKAAYRAWGELLSNLIEEALSPLIAPVSTGYFIKLPAAPRLKEDQKLVEKAFYRKKGYRDPYADITDKVGTRFVVLLGTHVRIVENALMSIEGLTYSKDRDYEEEQSENPLRFDYAAVHYVVRPTSDRVFHEIKVPAGTPCEVQIKTILQHAYSELTHDTIYKPQIQATPFMQRNAAKAMALLEATNDYFEKVDADVRKVLSSVKKMTSDLSEVYRSVVGLEPKPTTLEGLLLQAYESDIGDDFASDLRAFLDEHGFIARRVKQRVAEQNPIFMQPSVLLAYYAVNRSLRKAVSSWPLTPKEMEPILNDLGESLA
jgi:ppGpp synthetase/RelA/SpoT-type nucleotidyltranferase